MTNQCASGTNNIFLGDDNNLGSVRKRTGEFLKKEGRRPRILVANIGENETSRSMKAFAFALADMGFDVDISPSLQSPEKIAKLAVENDVHIVGLSGAADGYNALVSQLVETLRAEGGQEILIIVQGNIPKTDHVFFYETGVKEIFTPGMSIADSINKVLNALEKQ